MEEFIRFAADVITQVMNHHEVERARLRQALGDLLAADEELDQEGSVAGTARRRQVAMRRAALLLHAADEKEDGGDGRAADRTEHDEAKADGADDDQ